MKGFAIDIVRLCLFTLFLWFVLLAQQAAFENFWGISILFCFIAAGFFAPLWRIR